MSPPVFVVQNPRFCPLRRIAANFAKLLALLQRKAGSRRTRRTAVTLIVSRFDCEQ